MGFTCTDSKNCQDTAALGLRSNGRTRHDASFSYAPGKSFSAGDDLADIRAALAVVQLPSCMDDPQSLGNAAMARLKRTAEKVGAALTYQVIAPLRLLLLELCRESDKAWGAGICRMRWGKGVGFCT